MEREPISNTRKKVDIAVSSVSGGVIGVIGLIEENKIISQNFNLEDAIKTGGAILFGAVLVCNGAARLINSVKNSKKFEEQFSLRA